MTTIHPIILAGEGPGTDWIFARGSCPAPFAGAAGPAGTTLFQATCLRFGTSGAFAAPAVICRPENHESVREQLAAFAVPSREIIVADRGTSLAAALSTAVQGTLESCEATYVVLAADHVVEDIALFARAVEASARLAACGRNVVFGAGLPAYASAKRCIVRGSRVETEDVSLYEVAGFAGPPYPSAAETERSEERHFWNTGILVATGRNLLDAIEEHADRRSGLQAESRDATNGIPPSPAAFRRAAGSAAALSYTGQIAERIKGAALHVLEAGWQSAGLWSSVVEGLGQSQQFAYRVSGGGIVEPGVIAELLKSPDVVVVAGLEKGPDVAHIVRRASAPDVPPAPAATREPAPAASEAVKPTAKLFRLPPGRYMEARARDATSARWVVLNGFARIKLDDGERFLSAGETFDLAPAHWLQVENAGRELLTVLELNATSLKDIEEVIEWAIPIKKQSNGS